MFAVSASLGGEEVVWNDELTTEAEAEALVDEMFMNDEADSAVIYQLGDRAVWKSISHRWITAVC